MSEWFKEAVLKTVVAFGDRGFESHPLRQLVKEIHQKGNGVKKNDHKQESSATFKGEL